MDAPGSSDAAKGLWYSDPQGPWMPGGLSHQATPWLLTEVVIGVDLDRPGLDKSHIKVLVNSEGQTVFFGV